MTDLSETWGPIGEDEQGSFNGDEKGEGGMGAVEGRGHDFAEGRLLFARLRCRRQMCEEGSSSRAVLRLIESDSDPLIPPMPQILFLPTTPERGGCKKAGRDAPSTIIRGIRRRRSTDRRLFDFFVDHV